MKLGTPLRPGWTALWLDYVPQLKSSPGSRFMSQSQRPRGDCILEGCLGIRAVMTENNTHFVPMWFVLVNCTNCTGSNLFCKQEGTERILSARRKNPMKTTKLYSFDDSFETPKNKIKQIRQWLSVKYPNQLHRSNKVLSFLRQRPILTFFPRSAYSPLRENDLLVNAWRRPKRRRAACCIIE